MTRPILVVMTWRGGARFARCLESVSSAQAHFSRVLLSVTSEPDSEDMRLAAAFAATHPGVEVICTGRELPTMEHQAFWVDHLQGTGARPEDWIYWLAYDDQVRVRGIEVIVDEQGDWPLEHGTAYFGPWAMRHESSADPFDGPWDAPLESWTSFPGQGPTRLPVMEWIRQQLRQPTYMQMSGSVCPFESYIALRDGRPRKTGPMRIEMAIASAPPTTKVEEFSEPVSIIYGRANSDRASYGSAARKEDVHLLGWLGQRALRRPAELPGLAGIVAGSLADYGRSALGGRRLPQEEWRVRGVVAP